MLPLAETKSTVFRTRRAQAQRPWLHGSTKRCTARHARSQSQTSWSRRRGPYRRGTCAPPTHPSRIPNPLYTSTCVRALVAADGTDPGMRAAQGCRAVLRRCSASKAAARLASPVASPGLVDIRGVVETGVEREGVRYDAVERGVRRALGVKSAK